MLFQYPDNLLFTETPALHPLVLLFKARANFKPD